MDRVPLRSVFGQSVDKGKKKGKPPLPLLVLKRRRRAWQRDRDRKGGRFILCRWKEGVYCSSRLFRQMLCSTMPTHLDKPGTPVNKWTEGWTWFEYKKRETSCHKEGEIRSKSSLSPFLSTLCYSLRETPEVTSFSTGTEVKYFRLALCPKPSFRLRNTNYQ